MTRPNNPTLAKAIARYSAERVGDQWKGVCPDCGHHALSVKEGDKVPVVAYCLKEETDKTVIVLKAVESDPATNIYIAPKRKKRSHTQEQLEERLRIAEAALETDRQALDFLDSRGISIEAAKSFRLGVADYPSSGRCLVIPYFADFFRIEVIQLRFRQLAVPQKPDGSEDKSHKWRTDKATPGEYRLFNLPLLTERPENGNAPLVLTESELDAMMLCSMGFYAASVDSAKHMLTEADRTVLLEWKNIFLAYDQDDDGFACTTRFMAGVPYAHTIGGYGEAAKDLGDLRRLFCSQGKDFAQELQKLFDAAKAEHEKEPTNTDAGNGERFVRRNMGIVRHCKQRDKIGWFVWNGQRWRPDAIGMAMELGRQTIADFLAKAGKDFAEGKLDKEGYGAAYSWGMRSLSHNGLTHMLAQAGAGTPVCIEGSVFDAHPEPVNLQNGTYNLETGEFYRARKEDLLTQVAGVSYDPAAECPQWMHFIQGVTQGDEELTAYLQRVFGYLLTGSQREQCFFLFYGQGGTGKSTYWKTVRGILGDYFAMVAPGLFLKKAKFNKPTGNNATPGIAALVGKRVAATVEMEEGDKFDAGLIKSIVGGDAQTARPLYQPTFTFQPQAKPVFLVNHLPGTDDFSGGMEQRLRIVRFDHVFRGTPEEIKDLDKLLEAEYSGILNWSLAGLEAWQEGDSLQEPQSVKDAVKTYIAEENPVACWFRECCRANKAAGTPVGTAFESFKAWADANGEFCKSERWFGLRMAQLGYRSEQSHGVRRYWGFEIAVGESKFKLAAD